jgi:uncharacterized protein YjbI with pentapeptide repeats
MIGALSVAIPEAPSMANPEHVKILKQGTATWNKWREENLGIPDLSGADLRAAELQGVNLQKAYLERANLSEAKLAAANLAQASLAWSDLRQTELARARLTRAELRRANLSGANLREADLVWASLRKANLSGAGLVRADLTSARLGGAILTRARLEGAILSEAVIGVATLADVDLSGAVGLETVTHYGPSSLGLDTIYRSKGNIPEVFLRGAGVPEDFIVYMRSLAAHPIEFYSCFISYSSQDDEFARRLHADLQQANVRCWFAPEDLKIGDKFRTRIDESIRLYDKLMVILTENSIASNWVEEEVESALEKERKQGGKPVLFPIRLDDAAMDTDQAWAASLRRTRHIGDFRHWKDHDAFKTAFERLLRDLKSGG